MARRPLSASSVSTAAFAPTILPAWLGFPWGVRLGTRGLICVYSAYQTDKNPTGS